MGTFSAFIFPILLHKTEKLSDAESQKNEQEAPEFMEDTYTNSEMLLAIHEMIHSERDRQILRRRKIDGITIEKLSEEFDISVSQVKRILQKYAHILNELRMNPK